MPPTTLPTKTWIKAHLSNHKLPNSPNATNPMPKSYHFLIFCFAPLWIKTKTVLPLRTCSATDPPTALKFTGQKNQWGTK
jgi:hypothetical protein